MVDDRDVAGPQALDQVLGPAPEPRRAGSAGAGGRGPDLGAAQAGARPASARATIGRPTDRGDRRGPWRISAALSRALGGSEQLPRVPARGASSPLAAPSMRTISATSSSPSTRSTVARASPSTVRFVDPEVRRGQRGDLRQVRDADHLAVARQRAKPLADGARRVAADPGVDLVEHQRRLAARSPSPVSASMIRDSSPPEAASRSGDDSASPGWSRPGTRPSRRRRGRSPRDGARARPRAGPPPSPARASSAADPLARAPAPPRARPSPSSRREPGRARLGRRRAAASSSAARSSAFSSRSISLPAALGVLEHRLDRPAVLSLQPIERVEPLLDTARAARARPRSARGRRAARSPASSSSTAAARDPLGERVERRRRRPDRASPASAARQHRPRPAAVLGVAGDRRSAPAAAPRSASAWRSRSRSAASSRSSAGSGRDRLDLGELEAQQVEVALAGALALAELVELARAAAVASAWAAR